MNKSDWKRSWRSSNQKSRKEQSSRSKRCRGPGRAIYMFFFRGLDTTLCTQSTGGLRVASWAWDWPGRKAPWRQSTLKYLALPTPSPGLPHRRPVPSPPSPTGSFARFERFGDCRRVARRTCWPQRGIGPTWSSLPTSEASKRRRRTWTSSLRATTCHASFGDHQS